ncbi:nitrate assimilation regulatory nirA [Fusarium coicis]|nr:nitrate assimilation regulatory nirA [Fusarium coicis]
MDYEQHVGSFKLHTKTHIPQTCLQCKQRKVRCDKQRGTCRNCRRLGLLCSLNSDEHQLHERPSPSKIRLRGARACSYCRLKKIKCSATLPSCVACQQKDIRCTYPPLKRYRRAPEGYLLEETTLEEETPQQHECPSQERERGLQAVSQFSSSPLAAEPAEHQQQNEPEQQQEIYNDHQDDLVIDGEYECEHEHQPVQECSEEPQRGREREKEQESEHRRERTHQQQSQQHDEDDQRLEHQQYQRQRVDLHRQGQSTGNLPRFEETTTMPLSSPADSPASWHPSSTESVTRGSGYGGPSRDQIDTLLDVFFKFIYPMPSYAFLHPETTRRRCRSHDVHRALPASICAVTMLYLRREIDLDLDHSQDSSRRALKHIVASGEDTSAWISMAEESIWRSLESPSITKLQALLLVIHYYIETELFQRAFMLTATAARFATTMRLNYERHDLPPVAQEVRRRTLWSLKMVERYFSIGLAEFDSLPMEVIYIDFPRSEGDFMAMTNGQELDATGNDQASGDCHSYYGEGGSYGLVMQLEAIRNDVMKISRKIALLETPLGNLTDLFSHHLQTLASMEKPAPILQALLSADEASQPLGTSGNRDRSISRWLPRLLLAHISWHQAHCDINRILLPGYSEAAPGAVLAGHDHQALLIAEAQCLHHAMRIIYILTTLNQHSTQHHLLEFDTAICAYHATRLILFISRFGKGPARPSPVFAVSRAELCLAALKRFFRFSALVSPIIGELEESITIFSEQQKKKQNFPSSQPEVAGSIHATANQGSAAAANATHSAGTLSHNTTPGSSGITTNERGTASSYSATAPAMNSEPTECQAPQSEAHQLFSLQSQSRSDGQFSEAVRARQRLAVHSLLRRAELSNVGGDDEEYQRSNNDEVPPDSDTTPRRPSFTVGDDQNGPSIQRNHGATAEERPRVVGASAAITDATADLQLTNCHPRAHSVTNNHATKEKSRHLTAKFQDQELTSTRSPSVPGLFAWWAPQDWAWLLEDQLRELGEST